MSEVSGFAEFSALTLISMYSGFVVADEADLAFEQQYEKCIEMAGAFEPFLEQTGLTEEQMCAQSAERERRWVLDGSIVVEVDRKGCTAFGSFGKTAETCLPESFDGVKVVKILSSNDASTNFVFSVMAGLKARGVESILFEAKEQ